MENASAQTFGESRKNIFDPWDMMRKGDVETWDGDCDRNAQGRVSNPAFPEPDNPGFRAFSETQKSGFFYPNPG